MVLTLSETENHFRRSLPTSQETENRFRSVQRRKLKPVSAILCQPRRKLKTVSTKKHQGVSLLTPLSTPRSCVELSCVGSTQERSRNSSGASQFEALTAMFEIGVSPVQSPTRSYIIKCVALRHVANRLHKINHFFPKPDFAKELLLAVSSRFITCKHEQKDMRKVLPL
jgi:hypothetical protein